MAAPPEKKRKKQQQVMHDRFSVETTMVWGVADFRNPPFVDINTCLLQ